MKFEALFNSIKKDPEKFDFRKSINEHIKSEDYQPYNENIELREKLDGFLKEKDNTSLIRTAYEILKQNAFDIEVHIFAAQACFRLGKNTLFHIHNYIASSLLDCILKSGDGLDFLTAYKIINPNDEKVVFSFKQKYPVNRVYHEKLSRHYDIYTFEDSSNIFFDISIPFLSISGYREQFMKLKF